MPRSWIRAPKQRGRGPWQPPPPAAAVERFRRALLPASAPAGCGLPTALLAGPFPLPAALGAVPAKDDQGRPQPGEPGERGGPWKLAT